jgi:hypothetical protein
MDIHSQIIMEIQREMEALKTTFQEFKVERKNIQEIYIMETIYNYITREYTQEIYAWYDYEDECDDWYMDSCHFWDDNHFHILYDDSTPPYVENINVTNLEPVMTTSVHLHILQWYCSFQIQLRPFPTMWMDLHIWIHMTNVDLWIIIFLLSSDIFNVEFT